jgi:hypothetical protein
MKSKKVPCTVNAVVHAFVCIASAFLLIGTFVGEGGSNLLFELGFFAM